MLTYTIAISVIMLLTTGLCCGGYAYLARHATTKAERNIRYAEIILLCAIATVTLLSVSGLTDHLQKI